MLSYGYWLWKPYLIKKRLSQLKDGDLLFYTDAGSGFNLNYSSEFLKTRINQVKKTKKIMGIFTCKEKNYNKIDLVKHFGYENSPLFLNQRQYGAGAVLMMKTPEVVKFINEWYELGYKDNYHFIDDSPSNEPETKHFKAHRHDQSIYSLLCKKYNILLNTSLRGHRQTFFHTYRKRNGPLITEETNHIGIDLKKGNAGGTPPYYRRKRQILRNKDIVEKDVLQILSKYVKNNKLTINTAYNKLFTDIAFKRQKYLHIKYNSNNVIKKQTFIEDKSININNINNLECAIYSTNPDFDCKSSTKLTPNKPEIIKQNQPFKNVSEIVRNYLENNTLSFKESYNSKFPDIY